MQTDGRTHMTKLTVAFCNFANGSKSWRKFCPRTTLFTKIPPWLLWKHVRVSVVWNRWLPAELQHGGLPIWRDKIILVSMRYFKAFHEYAAYSSGCPSTCNNSDPNEWNLMQLRAVRGPYSILQIKFCIGPNLIIWYFGLCESLIGTSARADWWNRKIFQTKL